MEFVKVQNNSFREAQKEYEEELPDYLLNEQTTDDLEEEMAVRLDRMDVDDLHEFIYQNFITNNSISMYVKRHAFGLE